MYEQNATYLVKQSDLEAKKLNKISQKIVQKVLKWPLQYVNFQKFPVEHAPGLPRAFFILNILHNDSTRKKNTLETMANLGAPSLKKFREYVARMKTFSKGFLPHFWV